MQWSDVSKLIFARFDDLDDGIRDVGRRLDKHAEYHQTQTDRQLASIRAARWKAATLIIACVAATNGAVNLWHLIGR
jgi:hypothetical protein